MRKLLFFLTLSREDVREAGSLPPPPPFVVDHARLRSNRSDSSLEVKEAPLPPSSLHHKKWRLLSNVVESEERAD